MLTALGAIGLLLQTIPMFFYQFDEKAQESKGKSISTVRITAIDFFMGFENFDIS